MLIKRKVAACHVWLFGPRAQIVPPGPFISVHRSAVQRRVEAKPEALLVVSCPVSGG